MSMDEGPGEGAAGLGTCQLLCHGTQGSVARKSPQQACRDVGLLGRVQRPVP